MTTKLERHLTETDLALLESYRFKCNGVRDFTKAVLAGTHTGLLLFGSGGNGKSYSVRETLDERKIAEIQPEDTTIVEDEPDESDLPHAPMEFGYDTFVVHQGRITPKGLVEQMARFPQSLHLVEDAETMFDDKNCWGVLRMALHSQDHSLHSKRRITWKISTKGGSFDFWFTGSLVIVGNRLLSQDSEEVKAVMTRCPCVNFDITNNELIAKMKEMCKDGYKKIPGAHLTADDCFDVLEFLLTAIESDPELKRDAKGKEKKLNLRILISGFRYLALGRLEPTIKWRNMLLDQLKQMVGSTKQTRSARIHDEKKIAAEIAEQCKKEGWPQHIKLIQWCKAIGMDYEASNQPKESDEYKKWFNNAKTNFSRKNK